MKWNKKPTWSLSLKLTVKLLQECVICVSLLTLCFDGLSAGGSGCYSPGHCAAVGVPFRS